MSSVGNRSKKKHRTTTKQKLGTKKMPRKPKSVVNPDDWDAWSAHLLNRLSPKRLVELMPVGKSPCLLWGAPTALQQRPVGDLIARLDKLSRGSERKKRTFATDLQSWLDEPASNNTIEFALTCLAWCHALPQLAQELPAAPWWALLDRLVQVAAEAMTTPPDDVVVHQLLSGELPLTLCYLFSEVKSCRSLEDNALATLNQGVDELLDGEGLPEARHFGSLRGLLAVWTRAGFLARSMKAKFLRGETRLRYEWLVRQVLRATRADGEQLLSDEHTGTLRKRMLEASLELTPDDDDRRIAQVALAGSKNSSKSQLKSLPESDSHTEWGSLAILRSDWSRECQQLAVAYDETQIRSELVSHRIPLWSGECHTRLQVNGNALSAVSPWEEVCWHVDEDVSYLELEQKFEHDWLVQRQFVLARHDQLLLVADAVIGPAESEIAHYLTLPLSHDLQFEAGVETREGLLSEQRPQAWVMPLALPEWRAERVDASLARTEAGLQLFQSQRARAMYAPLLFDLNSRRVDQPRTWRQLTVAERLEIQPRDKAVGYRVQVGKAQWIVYRSLSQPGNRTVIGLNLNSEFHFCRFLRSGETVELLEIE